MYVKEVKERPVKRELVGIAVDRAASDPDGPHATWRGRGGGDLAGSQISDGPYRCNRDINVGLGCRNPVITGGDDGCRALQPRVVRHWYFENAEDHDLCAWRQAGNSNRAILESNRYIGRGRHIECERDGETQEKRDSQCHSRRLPTAC